MATSYTAEISWQLGDGDFAGNRYSRKHLLRFDGGAELPGSSSPHSVPLPMSDAAAVDPEEMFVAALSSCHMLWFLAIAAKRKFVVESYLDKAEGIMEKNAKGKIAVTLVTLRPDARFSAARLPTRAELDQLHHEAHDACYIANSVNSELRCEPVYPAP